MGFKTPLKATFEKSMLKLQGWISYQILGEREFFISTSANENRTGAEAENFQAVKIKVEDTQRNNIAMDKMMS